MPTVDIHMKQVIVGLVIACDWPVLALLFLATDLCYNLCVFTYACAHDAVLIISRLDLSHNGCIS